MAHGVSEVLGEGSTVVKMIAANKQQQQQQSASNLRKNVGVMGSRRIFAPAFKLKVLDSYRNDIDCRGNQRATARKYGIHRRQIQKWLQCEDNLRSCCSADGNSSSSSSSGSSSNVATPASSPQKELLHEPRSPSVPAPPAAAAAATVPQHHHHNGAPGSPALNLSLARLHGDELAAAAAAQQHQPPPPPPPPSSAAQALATQHQPTATAAAVANYRFHSAAATAAAAPPTGYPDLKDKVLPSQQHYQPPPPADYSMLEFYPPSLYQPHHQQSYFQPPAIGYPVQSPKLEEESSYPRGSLLAPADIKTERASPDSRRESVTPTATVAVQPKRERLDEEEHDFQRSASVSVSPPLPSQLHPLDYPHHHPHLEVLPPSPQHSDRSTGCSSSDSEMDQQSGGPNAADLARRRSFSLRFKLDVLDAFHRDANVAGNQRATARKFGINRRQVQKWLGQETELRGVIELCGSNNRQRLGPLQENAQTPYGPESPVDLRTSELGQVSPQRYQDFAVDSSLTPPYSAPGCSLSCCQEPSGAGQTYYCYSPESTPPSLKRSLCNEPCCNFAPKRLCTEEKREQPREDEQQQQQPIQETPLCLVKPKRPAEELASTPPAPPAPPAQPSTTDGILFKPYLDNPVSKPTSEESNAANNNNNNNQEVANLNERPTAQADQAPELSPRQPVSFRPPAPQQQVQYPEYLQRSAFFRYPTNGVHYS